MIVGNNFIEMENDCMSKCLVFGYVRFCILILSGGCLRFYHSENRNLLSKMHQRSDRFHQPIQMNSHQEHWNCNFPQKIEYQSDRRRFYHRTYCRGKYNSAHFSGIDRFSSLFFYGAKRKRTIIFFHKFFPSRKQLGSIL